MFANSGEFSHIQVQHQLTYQLEVKRLFVKMQRSRPVHASCLYNKIAGIAWDKPVW